MAKKKKILGFSMQPQLQPAWCWSAVGTSCALFYDPTSGWTQCKVVNQTLKLSSDDCCKNPSGLQCDVPAPLLNDKKQGSFITTHIPSSLEDGAIPIEKLINELDKGRLVAYRLEITLEHEIDIIIGGKENKISKFWHFVVIAGYEFDSTIPNDENVTVFVYDPYSLEKGFSAMSYATFQNNYKCHGGAVPDPTHHGSPDQETGCKITTSFFTAPIKNA